MEMAIAAKHARNFFPASYALRSYFNFRNSGHIHFILWYAANGNKGSARSDDHYNHQHEDEKDFQNFFHGVFSVWATMGLQFLKLCTAGFWIFQKAYF